MSDNDELIPEDIFLLAKTSIGVLLVMIFYETIKSLIFPDITALTSHVLTIFFTTFSFILFFNNYLAQARKKSNLLSSELEKQKLLVTNRDLEISKLKDKINSQSSHG